MIGRWAAMALVAGLLAQSGKTATDSETAVAQFARLRDQAAAQTKAGDKQARLKTMLAMQLMLPGSPSAAEAVAAAYAAVGDNEHALKELGQFAEMGQADDRVLDGADTHFTALHETPEYKAIVARMAANKSTKNRSETAFVLSDAGLLAEDIDYDPGAKSFLLTSVLEKKIVRVTMDGKATEFARSPSGWPMMALKVDARRGVVWATEVAVNGFTAVAKADWGRSAVLCYDLKSGKLLRRIDGGKTALGDMTLAPEGDAIVSDGDGGGVYRVAGGELKLINGTDFISPQTPTMLPGGEEVAVPDYVRGIGVLNLKSGRVRWVDGGGKTALDGVDGAYFDRGALMLTQNGSSPERVVRVQLDKALSKVVGEDTIERATATLGDPTHGVVVDGWFYFIANSGWDKLDEHGEKLAGARLTPARVMRYKLGPVNTYGMTATGASFSQF